MFSIVPVVIKFTIEELKEVLHVMGYPVVELSVSMMTLVLMAAPLLNMQKYNWSHCL